MQGQESLELLRESSQLRVALLLNLSQCSLKLEDFPAAAQHASDALDLEPSCKALFRRALAQLARGSLSEARDDLQAALQLEPQNREVREKLEVCRTRMQQAQAWQKQAFGGLFGKAPEQSSRQRSSETLKSLPKVWMEMQIGSKPAGRVEMILYKDTVPRTAENFLKLCTGELSTERRRLHYRHSIIHKVVPGCLIEAGDIEKSNGMGGQSIYGPSLSSALGLSLPEFDGKHVVFGEVSSGLQVLDAMEQVETESSEHLPILKEVLELNFPGLLVRVLDVTQPQPQDILDFAGPNETKGSKGCVYAGQWKWKVESEDELQASSLQAAASVWEWKNRNGWQRYLPEDECLLDQLQVECKGQQAETSGFSFGRGTMYKVDFLENL
ncbi:PCKR1, partial [Symbiodinium necroappetens]